MGEAMNKKAQSVTDIVYFFAFLLFIAIAALSTAYWSGLFSDGLLANPTLNATQSSREAIQSSDNLNDKWDFIILCVMIGFALSLVVTGYFIDVETIFMPFFIFTLALLFILSMAFQYVWTHFSTTSAFAVISIQQFPITNHIFDNLTIYYTIFGFIALVATYAKADGGR